VTQLPRVIGGKYQPIRLIGQGGMGAVFEVVHANTGEHLALKVLLARSLLAAELVERFRREARAANLVKSESVVRVTDADVAPELDGAPFLVMELLVGQDFERLSHEEGHTHAQIVGCGKWPGRSTRRIGSASSIAT
jgi:eukaryotic-like serine/threonine-protein kinase